MPARAPKYFIAEGGGLLSPPGVPPGVERHDGGNAATGTVGIMNLNNNLAVE